MKPSLAEIFGFGLSLLDLGGLDAVRYLGRLQTLTY
jgi:hypothetical protein